MSSEDVAKQRRSPQVSSEDVAKQRRSREFNPRPVHSYVYHIDTFKNVIFLP